MPKICWRPMVAGALFAVVSLGLLFVGVAYGSGEETPMAQLVWAFPLFVVSL